MPTFRIAAPLTIAAALVAATALADTMRFPDAKVNVEVPASWTATPNGHELRMQDAKDDVEVSITSIPAAATDKIGDAVGRELAKTIEKIKIQEQKDVNINGMKGAMVSGDGWVHGKNIDWMLVMLDTPSTEHNLMVLAVGEDARIAHHTDEVKYLFNHIAPAP